MSDTQHEDGPTIASGGGLPAAIEALVVKEQVHLGTLTHEVRLQALALLWCALPRSPLDERGVNEVLKAQLTGSCAFLATDHVELRRWLVDSGFVARDGFGRVYERVAIDGLPADARAAAAPLRALAGADGDAGAVLTACRAARERRQHERARRRAAWEATAAGAAAGAR